MLIKSKLVLFCSIFTLAMTVVMFPSDDIKADGVSACPAFTSAMVDAAALASHLWSPRAFVNAEDDPTTPSIFCHIAECESCGNDFIVEVNFLNPGQASVSAVGAAEGGTYPYDTQLLIGSEQLSLGQIQACRKVILKSFVWNNYCAPKQSGPILN